MPVARILLTAILVGAECGGSFRALGHPATRGQRDFSAMRAMAAAHYDVIARDAGPRRRVIC